jgi:hypothetical protein
MINIKHSISPDRHKLTLKIYDEDERIKLLEEICYTDNAHSDQFLNDVLDHLVSSSELSFVLPEETGDLTEAPMLGIRDEDDKVLERWGYMSYQVKSLVRQLALDGEVTLVASN